DSEIAAPVADCLLEHGVDLRLSDSATALERGNSDADIQVRLQSGADVEAQLVVLGVGVRPESHLAEKAGLKIGSRGGIQVNRHMQTSDPDIYAVGDVVESFDFITEQPAQVPLAGPANRQGRIAADNVVGRDSRFRGYQGTAIVRIFELTVAMTGAS